MARIWSSGDWRVEAELEHADGLRSIAFSPDGDLLATASSDMSLRLWDLASGTERGRVDLEESVDILAFSPDGRRLAAGGRGGQEGTIGGLLRMIDAATMAELYRIPHEWPVTRALFSPDGHDLASATSVTSYVPGNKGWRVRLFDVDSGDELARVEQSAPLLDLRFSPDGQWLATGGRDNTAAIWAWREPDLIGLACHRLTRNLSAWEWEDHFGKEEYRETCPGLPKPEKLPVPRNKRYLKITPGDVTPRTE